MDAPANPEGFYSDYDRISDTHSSQITGMVSWREGEEPEEWPINPIERWTFQWYNEPWVTKDLNVCSRNNWEPKTMCTALKKQIFDCLKLYASSRPDGAPAFTCHFRRKTGEKDYEAYKKGDVITAWETQLLAASPPVRPTCLNAGQIGDAAIGKCYEVHVPANSTYVVLNEYNELLFPPGCRFKVEKDESSGENVMVTLDQSQVERTPELFPGTPDPEQSDESWWNGVIALLTRAGSHNWSKATLRTPNGIILILDSDNEAWKNEDFCKLIRSNLHESVIEYESRRDWSIEEDLEMSITSILRSYPNEAMDETRQIRQDAWRALAGQSPIKMYKLKFERIHTPPPAKKQKSLDDALCSFVDLVILTQS